MLNFKITISLIVGSVAPYIARAETLDYSSIIKLQCQSIPDCLELIFRTARNVAFPVAVVFIIWSGFLFISAQGNPEKIKTARTTLLWALVGLAVIVGAWTLALAFKNSFTNL